MDFTSQDYYREPAASTVKISIAQPSVLLPIDLLPNDGDRLLIDDGGVPTLNR